MTHNETVEFAAEWLLRRRNCDFVMIEPAAYGSVERPDVIGFKLGISFLIECKTSKVDFLSDKKKEFRTGQRKGMGVFRYYMCGEGILSEEDMPPKWGLLLADKHGRVEVVSGFDEVYVEPSCLAHKFSNDRDIYAEFRLTTGLLKKFINGITGRKFRWKRDGRPIMLSLV